MATIDLGAVYRSLFGQTEAEKRADMAQGLFGSPNAVRTEGTMYSADVNEQGQEVNQQMTAQAPTYQSTGLFEGLRPEQVPQMQYAKDLMASGDAGMQKQSMSAVEDVLAMEQGGGQPTAADYLDARVNAYGAPERLVDGKNVNEGKMQRGLIDAQGNVDWKGEAYYPRNEFLDVGTGYQNKYNDGNSIQKQLALAEFRKKEGVAAQARMDEFPIKIDKAEASLESIDFMVNELDVLANSATGFSTGWGGLLKDVPYTDANTWNTIKDGVLSNIGIEKLSEMKAQTKTGASGMGQLNEKELAILTEYRGKLEQTNDPKVIKRIVKNMQRLIANSRKRLVTNIRNEQKWFDKKTKKYGYDPVGVRGLPNNLEPANKPTRIWGQDK